MPTYQYACTSDQCGLRFERVQAFTDPAISECPDCNERVRKVYGSVGVVFKGSGFYRNDSRNGKAGANGTSDGAKANGKDADAGKGSEAAKSDAGTATKSADSAGSGTSSGKAESSKPAATVAS
ncbi:FmdB family zinc ribbon protein [Jatrophihabitans sp.]|jgi:putative FmdB family regulatory protein|uniref:FmdB family zinc ribbon protein n=1 Tax=Jatrophihabitans sp. TaxID=1932789 RepID=UPI002EEC2870